MKQNDKIPDNISLRYIVSTTTYFRIIYHRLIYLITVFSELLHSLQRWGVNGDTNSQFITTLSLSNVFNFFPLRLALCVAEWRQRTTIIVVDDGDV